MFPIPKFILIMLVTVVPIEAGKIKQKQEVDHLESIQDILNGS